MPRVDIKSLYDHIPITKFITKIKKKYIYTKM